MVSPLLVLLPLTCQYVATDKHSFRLQPLFNSTGSKLYTAGGGVTGVAIASAARCAKAAGVVPVLNYCSSRVVTAFFRARAARLQAGVHDDVIGVLRHQAQR